ncbi:hypothetical protein Ancab_017122 [Ancistrocladus abbreviatus]
MGLEGHRLHVFFFPLLAHGHMIPTLDTTRLFTARGAKITIATTPLNAPIFTKAIETSKAEINVKVYRFPAKEDGLPEGVENYEYVNSMDEVFIVPNLPDEIKLTRVQLPENRRQDVETDLTRLVDRCKEAERKSFGVIMNSFYELESAYVDYYGKVRGRRAWPIGPVSLCNRNIEDKTQRGKKAYVDEYECLQWLDSKEPNSVIYVCFGSITKFSVAQLHEIAMALEASGQQFIWVVRGSMDQEADDQEGLPKDFEKRMEGKDHQATGGFVTHCGWNSTLEGIAAGVSMVTWPIFAEQFYNEKLVTQVLKTGIPVGVKQWSGLEVEFIVEQDAIEKAVKQIMVGKEAEEIRDRAEKLRDMT